MPRVGEGLVHIPLRGLICHVNHGGSPEFRGHGLLRFLLVLEFDNSEQAITQFRELPRNEAGKLLLASVPINPATDPVGRKNCRKRSSRDQNSEARKCRDRKKSLKREDDQE